VLMSSLGGAAGRASSQDSFSLRKYPSAKLWISAVSGNWSICGWLSAIAASIKPVHGGAERSVSPTAR
jgi:hypothetical protein